MKTFIMSRDQLETTIQNGRWFAGFRCRWKQTSKDAYRVVTNYVIASMEPGL